MRKAVTILLLILLLTLSAFATKADVFYVSDSGFGDGSSPASASSSLADAYNVLANGGTIVICGEYNMTSALTGHTNVGKITVTSLYNGVDYRENGACINFGYNYYCGGETEFNNVVLNSAATYPSIYANGYTLTLGEGIECGKVSDSKQFLSVMGGSRNAYTNHESFLTINSGTWQRVRGGTTVNGSKNYKVNLVINGGDFIERVTLGSSDSHDGDVVATVNGGTFRQGIVATTLSASGVYRGNITLTLNGGIFYSKVGVAATNLGTYSGSFNLTVNGGEFAHLTELCGGANLNGAMSSFVSGKVNFGEKESGTYVLQNPIRNDGADPWLFYYDGYYYYTSTTSSSAVKLTRARNIGDLMYYGGTTIYTPEADKLWSNSTWSPTVIHYTDEEIGEGNGGWYLYFGGEDETDTSDVGHRMYVLKCLDGDNLLGRWGNPLTGELNVPQRVSAPNIDGFDDVWAAGQGDIRINGKVYTIYVTEEGRYTPDFHQTINILPMTNPWTFDGKSSIICVPEYDWETVGYGVLSNGLWAPKVVEAATPVYGDDGSVFIVYSGSNYTRDAYCLGQLKYLGGDPMEKSNWEKKPTPILSQGNGVRGTGSASYVVDTSGQGWVCYNAYLDSDKTRTRHAMVEPYTASSAGVVIGDGSGKAAPQTKTYLAAVNPMSLAEKMSGFDNITVSGEIADGVVKISFSAVDGADFYNIKRDGIDVGTVFASSGVFEYTDENITLGAHVYKVEAVFACEVIAENFARVVSYDGLLYGDMNADGEITVLDSLILLKEILNASIDASIICVLHQFKCIF